MFGVKAKGKKTVGQITRPELPPSEQKHLSDALQEHIFLTE